jgi:hypothetical protein
MPHVTPAEKEKAARQFIAWIGKNFPASKTAMVQANHASLGAVDTTAPVAVPWYETALNTLAKTATVFAQTKAQQDLIKANLERAKQGLPPLDVSTVSPTVQVTTDTTMKTLIGVGLGVLVLAVVLPPLIRNLR